MAEMLPDVAKTAKRRLASGPRGRTCHLILTGIGT
jgi:hypothetical protein